MTRWTYAHYFATAARKVVVFANSAALNGAQEEVEVTGKRQARTFAAQRGAQCWNF